jgi:hypothetical protein
MTTLFSLLSNAALISTVFAALKVTSEPNDTEVPLIVPTTALP